MPLDIEMEHMIIENSNEKTPLLPIVKTYVITTPKSAKKSFFSKLTAYLPESTLPYVDSLCNVMIQIKVKLPSPKLPSTSRKNLLFYLTILNLFFLYRYINGGPFLPLSCQLINVGCPNNVI